MAGGQKVVREYLGEADCPLCGRLAPVRKQANGYNILKCGFCSATLQTHESKSSALLGAKIKNAIDTPPAAPIVHTPAAKPQTPPPNTQTAQTPKGLW